MPQEHVSRLAVPGWWMVGVNRLYPKGIIGLYSALFKKKGQAIELRRLIRLN